MMIIIILLLSLLVIIIINNRLTVADNMHILFKSVFANYFLLFYLYFGLKFGRGNCRVFAYASFVLRKNFLRRLTSAHSLSQAQGRLFLCVDWPCWLCLFVKYTRCERLLLVEVCKAFLLAFVVVVVFVVVFSSLENYFGFRATNCNVKGRTDHSVSLRWNKRFQHFQREEYFSDNCAFELRVDFVSSASHSIAGLN